MPYNIDSDVENADWAKRTWDIHGTPDEQAEWILGMGQGSRQENLDLFLALPAAKAMPKDVKAAIRKRGFRV